MTTISTIIDGLSTAISTELPNHAKIPNAYNLEDNPNVFLKKGFAVASFGANNTERHLSCLFSAERSFSVFLTNQLTANIMDYDSIQAVVKDLFEDHYKVVKAISKDPTLNQSSAVCKFANDAGIQFLEAGSAKYLVLQINFVIEYFENLNT